MFPQPFLAAFLLQNGPEQPTGQLLDLVDEKGQHHQGDQYHRQILFAVSEVVFELILLVLQGVEGLVLDLPTRPPSPHDREHGQLGAGEISDPGKVLGLVLSDLPVLNKAHQYVRI